jgi:uncharacterized membrane protein HdeD (DUF308 family)
MKRSIKAVFLFIGVILLAYGIYILEIPETNFSINDKIIEEHQDNSNAYIIIGLGVLSVILSLIKEKEKK